MLLRTSPLLSSAIRRTPCDLSSTSPTLLAKSVRALVPAPSSRGAIRCCASRRRSEDAGIAATVAAVEEELPAEAELGDQRAEWAERAEAETADAGLSVGMGSPSLIPFGLAVHRMSLGDRAFFLLAFIACTTSIAFTSLVFAAVPTLLAMRRAAISLARLADTAREELPSTMAAIRLSGMEISDLTLELSDLSQEIADGVSKSAQAVQAAEAGIRQIGALARRQTMTMIQERANLPSISFKPVVAGAAKKTSHVVGQAKKTFMNIISRGDSNSDSDSASDKVEI